MRHPDSFEPAFDASPSAWKTGLQGARPLPGGLRGVPMSVTFRGSRGTSSPWRGFGGIPQLLLFFPRAPAAAQKGGGSSYRYRLFGSRFSGGVARGAAPAGGSGGCPPSFFFFTCLFCLRQNRQVKRDGKEVLEKNLPLRGPPTQVATQPDTRGITTYGPDSYQTLHWFSLYCARHLVHYIYRGLSRTRRSD